jgi:prolyl-tRNA editing enzyme YbaK/EbsC (Cys-tRNA(Pro) deacylase)
MSARGTLSWSPAAEHPELVGPPVAAALPAFPTALVAPIDPALADTAEFCAAYQSDPEHSANCVVVAGRRGGVETWAAVMVLATDRADINNLVRRHLDVRKISFAPMDEAVSRTGMEYGGITPIGLPGEWPVLVDSAVAAAGEVVIGSGIRGSKLLVDGSALLALPNAVELPLVRRE